MKKKLKIFLILYLILYYMFLLSIVDVFAQDIDTVSEILGQIDLSALEDLFNNLSLSEKELLGGSFNEFLSNLINGNTVETFGLLRYGFTVFSSIFKEILPSFLAVFSSIILTSILNGIKPTFASNSISNVFSFGSALIVGSTLCFSLSQIITKSILFIKTISNLSQIVFPIVFSVLITMGASTSVGVLQGCLSVFLSIISSLINCFVLPIALGSSLLSIITNTSQSLSLSKFPTYLTKIAKNTLNIIFALFFSVVGIQGVSSQVFDSATIRIAKFSLSKYVPFLGGYLSTGFDYLYSGSVIIKNSMGIAFLLLLFVMVLPILINLFLIKLSIQVLSFTSNAVGNNACEKMLNGICSSTSLMITCVVGVALSLGFFVVMIILSFNSLV